MEEQLDACLIASRLEMMKTYIKNELNAEPWNFDMSLCEGPGENVVPQIPPCSSRIQIKETCLDVNRTETGCL